MRLLAGAAAARCCRSWWSAAQDLADEVGRRAASRRSATAEGALAVVAGLDRATALDRPGRGQRRDPGRRAVGRGQPRLDLPEPRAGRCPATAPWCRRWSTATGLEPVVVGKPEPELHRTSVERVGAQRPLVVGDRLDTDVLGAVRAGARQPARPHRRDRPRPAARGARRACGPPTSAPTCAGSEPRHEVPVVDGDTATLRRRRRPGTTGKCCSGAATAMTRCGQRARWPGAGLEERAQPQQVARAGLDADPAGREGASPTASRPSVRAIRSSLPTVSRICAFASSPVVRSVMPSTESRADQVTSRSLTRHGHRAVHDVAGADVRVDLGEHRHERADSRLALVLRRHSLSVRPRGLRLTVAGLAVASRARQRGRPRRRRERRGEGLPGPRERPHGGHQAARRRRRQGARRAGRAAAGQVTALADDLVAQSKSNREAVTALVRFEVDKALGRVGLASAEEVTELNARVRPLEAELRRVGRLRRGRQDRRRQAAGRRPPPSPRRQGAAAKKAPAKKAAAKKAPAKKADPCLTARSDDRAAPCSTSSTTLPVAEHVEVFDAVHRSLQDALADARRGLTWRVGRASTPSWSGAVWPAAASTPPS